MPTRAVEGGQDGPRLDARDRDAPWPFEIRGGLGGRTVARLPQPEPEMPNRRRLQVFSQDPGVSRLQGGIYTLSIPYEAIGKGPRGAVLVVEDIDEDSGATTDSVDLDQAALLMSDGLDPSSTNPQFMQQMVYAVGMETYDRFRRALGRDPGFGPLGGDGAIDGKLRIRPRFSREPNAYYDRETGALKFGYDVARKFAHYRSQPGSHVFTALSRDIVAHEMSHALLDGLRPNFLRPTHGDVDALHEGFADLVAVFLRFAQREIVERAIENAQGSDLTDELLVSIGQQFGFNLVDGRNPLRTAILSVDLSDQVVDRKYLYTENHEAHELGAVLVSAVFEAFRRVFKRKTQTLRHVLALYQGRLPAEGVQLLAQEASHLARRFLNIVIRAVDYCPPLHCTFGEYLRAIITADHDLVNDDPFGHREAFITSFRRFGVTVPDVADLSEESLMWRSPQSGLMVIPELEFENLGLAFADGLCDWPDDGGTAVRRAADALGRVVCTDRHGHDFGVARPTATIANPRVMSLRTLRRAGSHGDVRFDLVAEVVQKRRVREGWFLGGSTIIVSSEGQVRYAIAKHIDSERRLRAQRQWLKTQDPDVRNAGWAEHSMVAARLQRRLHREP